MLDSWDKQLDKDYERFAKGIENLPKSGDLSSVNYETVLALKPDLVIVTNYMPK